MTVHTKDGKSSHGNFKLVKAPKGYFNFSATETHNNKKKKPHNTTKPEVN